MEQWFWLAIVAIGVMLFFMFRRGGCCGHMAATGRKEDSEPHDGSPQHDRPEQRSGRCH